MGRAIRAGWRQLLIAVTVALLLAGCRSTEKSPADFRAQKATVFRIFRLTSAFERFRDAQGEYPVNLKALEAALGVKSSDTLDGWGRPFYYYRSEASYLLVSFGRDGTPDPQEVEHGWVLKRRDYDTDIVAIGGEWAQTPYEVDAPRLTW